MLGPALVHALRQIVRGELEVRFTPPAAVQPSRWMTPPAACRLTRVPVKTIRAWVRDGRIPKRLENRSANPKQQKYLVNVDDVIAIAERVGVTAHRKPRESAAVLLGGDAGLRAGEVMALELTDVSRANLRVTVERQVWRGVVDSPKGGRGRTVPMTEALATALAAVRHLRGPRVLVQDDGSEVTAKVLRAWMKSAQRLAGLKPTGNFHILRHTFCSHLAMRGGAAKAIQELAGHTHLSTTMRYMHLAEGHKEQTIRLRSPGAASRRGGGGGGGGGLKRKRPGEPGR